MFLIFSFNFNFEWKNTLGIINDAVNIRPGDVEWWTILNTNRMLLTQPSFGYGEVQFILIFYYSLVLKFLVAMHVHINVKIFSKDWKFRTSVMMKTYVSRIQFPNLFISYIFYSSLFDIVFFLTTSTHLWFYLLYNSFIKQNGDTISNDF